MELFTFIPYFLLLEREESDRNTLANANTEFIREVYELQRVEKDVTLVFFPAAISKLQTGHSA